MSAKPVVRKKTVKTSEFGLFGIETTRTTLNLINTLGDKNTIIDDGDECYFLMFNIMDFHRPLLAKGRVHSKEYIQGVNVIYAIQLERIIENEDVMYDFVTGDIPFAYNNIDSFDKVTPTAKNLYFRREEDIDEFANECMGRIKCILTQAFFVRKTFEEAEKLQKDYAFFVREKLVQQVQELDFILKDYIK